MITRVLVLFTCMAIIFSGCAGTSGEMPSRLPASYGPLEYDAELMTKLNEVFDNRPPLAGKYNIPQLRSIARKTRSAPVAVFDCDLAIFKAFIASDWTPIIIFGAPRGRRHFRAILGYDDSAGEFIILDPRDSTQSKIEYKRFFRLLPKPQNACLLMFSRYVGQASIRRALKNYIPENRAEKIPMLTPRDK